MRKLRIAPQGEKPAEKTVRLGQLKVAVDELVEAEIHEDAKLATVYEFFRKTLKEDPELQWDRIVTDMHTKDPWEDLKACAWGRARQREPREGPYRQVLQVVQGCRRAVHNSQHHRVS